MTPSDLFVLAALLVSIFSLAAIRLRFGGANPRAQFAEPKGSVNACLRYAFTSAFLPWEKESARRHLLSYLAGVLYHLTIFIMLAVLVITLFDVALPEYYRITLAGLFAAGFACGVGLLVKRIVDGKMRAISVPEDYLANLLVSLTLASATLAALVPPSLPVFQVMGGILLLYVPLGKLRHMLFLITSRFYWGVYFGRRGLLARTRGAGGLDERR